MPKNSDQTTVEANIVEKLGWISAPVLVGAGFFIFLWGSYPLLRDSKSWEAFFLNDFGLIALMFLPFIIQIPIFVQFGSEFKSELKESKKLIIALEKGSTEFMKYYGWFMFFGLTGYSILWMMYNYDLNYWSQEWITSFLALVFILILIWIVGLCTKIIIGSRKNDGLFTEANLQGREYEILCKRMKAVEKADWFLNQKDTSLEMLITTINPVQAGNTSAVRDRQADIEEIVHVFSNLGRIQLPLAVGDNRINEIVSVLMDDHERTRIRPAKRVLDRLKDFDREVATSLSNGDRDVVSKKRVINALNQIIRDRDFYLQSEFSSSADDSPEVSAAYEFFNDRRKLRKRSGKDIQKENRILFDFHLLEIALDGERSPNKKGRKFKALISFVGQIFMLWLNDSRERKLVEGLQRFHFQMLLFFFTIFICIVYLFAFAFAFHDRSTLLKNSLTKTPALLMDIEYPKPIVSREPEIRKYADFGMPKAALPHSQKSADFFFFFYSLRNSGTGFSDINTDSWDANSALDVNLTEKVTARREISNKQNVDLFLAKLRESSPTSRKIFIEIIGRTDNRPVDQKVDSTDPKRGNTPVKSADTPLQTYSSNYDLSLARADNVKFELLRLLHEKYPDILEKIEWVCIPGSNDESLGRGLPFAIRQPYAMADSTVNKRSQNSDTAELNSVAKIDELYRNILGQLPGLSEEPKRTAILARQNLLLSQIANVKKLIDPSLIEKATDKKSSNTSNLTLRKPLDPRYADEFLRRLKVEAETYESIKNGPNEKTEAAQTEFMRQIDKFDSTGRDIDSALVFFASDGDSANKRVTEVYIDTVSYAEPDHQMNLTDYILYSITVASYADIKPITQYARLLSILLCLCTAFFVVVFLNALMSVRRTGDEATA